MESWFLASPKWIVEPSCHSREACPKDPLVSSHVQSSGSPAAHCYKPSLLGYDPLPLLSTVYLIVLLILG